MGGLKKGCDLNFYRCIFRTEYGCEHFKGKKSKCAYGVAHSFISKEHLKQLASDTKLNGYSAIPIELHILYANRVDWLIEHEDGRTQSLKLETDRDTIAPFRVADFPKKKIGVRPSLRGSEFSKKNHCQRIWSKVRKRHFGLTDTELSLIGRSAHTICNQQHLPYIVENSILEEIKQPVVSRDKYCEVEVFLEKEVEGTPIGISGHADAILHVTPKGRLGSNQFGDIMIFDLKRKAYSMYEEWGYKMQELTYALAIEQQYGIGSEWMYLMTAKRPRKPAWNSHRMLQYHMTKIRNNENSPTIRRLENEIAETYVAQSELLSSLGAYKANKEKMKKKGFCAKCFDADICRLALKEAKRNRLPLGELLEDELKAVAPRMVLPR